VPAIRRQEMAKKCRFNQKIKKNKETQQSPTFGSCFGVPQNSSRCPRGLVWGERQTSPRCRGPRRSRKGGAGGARRSLGVWGIFGGVPVGPFPRVARLRAAGARAGSGTSRPSSGGGREAASILLLPGARGVRGGPGADPLIKVTAVGSTRQRRCDYF